MAGALFGARYELGDMLGSGGMARVHRALDTRLGRTVAVKTLLTEVARDPEARNRFAREARAAAALNHPGIVTVHDQDEVRDEDDNIVPYLVMEYIDGSTLEDIADAEAPLDVERAVRIVSDVLDALAHAHSRGTVHRDVKPANVMITKSGAVKVADFGIARVVDATTRITGTGFTVGTPGYMSPEQVLGREVDARSDLYAVGCLLTELLTGDVPFTGSSALNVMYWQVHQQPPAPSQRNPAVPAELDALVLKALSKDPDDRPQDAASMRDSLRAALRSSASPTSSPAASSPPPSPAANGDGGGGGDSDPRASFTLIKNAVPAPPADTDDVRDTPPFADPAAYPAPAASGPTSGPVSTPSPMPPPVSPPTQYPPYVPGPWGPVPQQGGNPYQQPLGPPPPSVPTPQPHPIQPVPPGYPGGYQGPPAPAGPRGPRSKRPWVIGGVAAAVAGLIVAGTVLFGPFGGDKDPGKRGPKDIFSARETGKGFNGALAGSVNPSRKKGGTLTMGTAYGVDSLDPARSYTPTAWNFQRIYLRKLVDYAAAPGLAGRKLKPDLATSTGKVTDGGKTYTFTLKDGVRFEDGTAITSKDVKYGIERSFDRTTFGTGPSYLVDLLDQGQDYPGPYKDTDPDKLGLKSVETPDNHTIVFHLDKPYADFPYVLAMSIAAPVPKDQDRNDGKDYERKPVASGPYRIESEFTPNTSTTVTLVRNNEWKSSTDPIRTALPDKIELRLMTSQDKVDQDLLAGILDVDASQVGVGVTAQAQILTHRTLKDRSDSAYTGAVRYFSIQESVAPFDDFHCRRAVQYAVDKPKLRDVLGGATSGGDVASGMIPPTILGFDEGLDPYDTKSGPQVEEAKRELKECGKPDGFTTKLVAVNSTPKNREVLEVLKQNLDAIGVDADIETVAASDYYRSLGDHAKVKKDKWAIALVSWASDWPAPAGFLSPLVGKDSSYNYTGLDDPELNDAMDKAQAEKDPKDAESLWQDVDEQLMGQAVLLPFLHDRQLNYRGKRLTNVYIHPALGGVDLQALGVKDG